MFPNDILFIPNFVKIYRLNQKLKCDIRSLVHTQNSNLVRFLFLQLSLKVH